MTNNFKKKGASFWDYYFEKNGEFEDLLINGEQKEIKDLISFINNIPLETFFEMSYNRPVSRTIQSSDIIQYSNFDDGTKKLCNVLIEYGHQNYIDLGQRLHPSDNDVSRQKYGQEHSRLGCSLMLCTLITVDRKKTAEISNFGKVFNKLSNKEKNKVLKRLLYRLSFLRLLSKDVYCKKNIWYSDYCIDKDGNRIISPSSEKRRSSNIKELLNIMFEDNSYGFLIDHINF